MASSSSSSSWMPSKGRHAVHVGSSLVRVIKNRKLKGSPAPATKRSTLPDRDLYSFKFNFKASSIDTTKPATIEIKKGAENSRVMAEYPSTLPGEVQLFSGSEQPAKEVDCILIYDEEFGSYTLEKLDSFVVLKSEGKKAVSPRPTSPVPVVSSASSSKGKAKQEEYDLDQTMSGLDEDAEGEVDDFEEVVPPSVTFRYEEEEEEGEEIEVPLLQVIPPKPQPPPPKAARAVKPLPSRVEAKAPAATPPQPTKSKLPPPPTPPTVAAPAVVSAPPKAKPAQPKPKKAKPAASIPAPSTSYAAEEEIVKPAKRARPSTPQQPPSKPAPAPRSPVALSLPGGTTSFAPPPAPASSRPSASSSSRGAASTLQSAPVPASPVLVAQADTSEDEEDWEPVPPASTAVSHDGNGSAGFDVSLEEALEEDIFGDGFGEVDGDRDGDGDGDGEEIDANQFAMELDEQMEESEGDVEDDFLAAAVSPEPEQQTRQPISLNRLASGVGAAVGDTDEEFSSSEESDED